MKLYLASSTSIFVSKKEQCVVISLSIADGSYPEEIHGPRCPKVMSLNLQTDFEEVVDLCRMIGIQVNHITVITLEIMRVDDLVCAN